MITTKSFNEDMAENLVKIKVLKNVLGEGKELWAGEIYEVSQNIANVLISYGDAEISDKPKKKSAKKVAKAKPPVDAER
jgi:hypothetical protein